MMGNYPASAAVDTVGVYPGSRYGASVVIDRTGSTKYLYVYGGYGMGRGFTGGKLYQGSSSITDCWVALNDLWRLNLKTLTWAWMSGQANGAVAGTYGQRGVPSPSNYPPSTYNHRAFFEMTTRTMWMFGGYGPTTGKLWFTTPQGLIFTGGYLSNLWRYSVNDTMWTWMSGSDGSSSTYLATYGLQGIEGPTVTPGGRLSTGLFYNASAGVFYIQGGMIFASLYSLTACTYGLQAMATLLHLLVLSRIFFVTI